MDFTTLKQQMQAIVEITNSVPEKYQEQCFEILLNHLLDDLHPPSPSSQIPKQGITDSIAPTNASPIEKHSIPINAKARAFLRRVKVSESSLDNLYIYEQTEDGSGILHLTSKPDYSSLATTESQIQLSLLKALESLLLHEDLGVDAETVRQMCKDENVYDGSNFWKNFKLRAQYFRQTPDSKNPRLSLSSEGEKALAELIKSLTGDNQ